MQRIALDAMGGDGAPRVIIEGALSAVREWPDRFVVSLVGIPERIREVLPPEFPDAIQIVPAAEVVEDRLMADADVSGDVLERDPTGPQRQQPLASRGEDLTPRLDGRQPAARSRSRVCLSSHALSS